MDLNKSRRFFLAGTGALALSAVARAAMAQEQDFLQPGKEQVAAGYAIYGPSTQLVLTIGNGVHGFTLDREMGSFIYTHPFMTIPADTKEYAINASNARFWEAPVKRYIDELLQGRSGPRGTDFNMRWVASMVADVHRGPLLPCSSSSM